MRPIHSIVIHCSASANGESLFRGKLGERGYRTPIEVIDEWHRKKGFQRYAQARRSCNHDLTSIGYHFVIYTNGAPASGRSIEEPGAHVHGHNSNSIGICLIGTDKFTLLQWDQLAQLIAALQQRYPNARIVGHRDLSPDRNGDGQVSPNEYLKTCPGFNVGLWLRQGKKPLAAHIFTPNEKKEFQ